MFQAFQFRRLSLLTSLLLLGLAGLEGRLFRLQIQRHEELTRKAAAFTETTRVLPPWRGEIRERTGTTLAASQPLVTVWVNLSLIKNRVAEVARAVAPLLGSSDAALDSWLRSHLSRPGANGQLAPKKAVMLKRHITLEHWEVISNALAQASFGFQGKSLTRPQLTLLKRLQRETLYAEDEQVRVYPYANSLAHLTGYVMGPGNSSWPKGVFGVERALDEVLAGTPGLCVSDQDAAGRELPFRRRHFVAPVNGNHVVLTIDLNVQQMAERALLSAARLHAPKSASVIVMRPRTGEILAWASWPGLDVQSLSQAKTPDWRNHALSDKCEPGSTFKIFTLAAALNEKQVTLDDWIYGENGRWVTNRMAVHDHARFGWLTVRQAIAKSSNVVFAKIALRLGADRLHQYITRFGFGQTTGVPLAYETSGYVPSLENCSNLVTLARLGFGQGLSVSQLQMTLGVSAICNDGRLMRPLLVSQIETPEGQILRRIQPQVVRSVISPYAARQVREALQGVLTAEGTGAQARLRFHTAGGKTGTAQKANATGYLSDRYYASFIGFFPVDEPEICISVAIDEPHNGHYGGAVAAPVFRVIAEQVAAYLDIPQDKNAVVAVQGGPTPVEAVDATATSDVDSESVLSPAGSTSTLAHVSRP